MKKLYKSRHCVYMLRVHMIFVVKYRKHVMSNEHLEYLESIMSKLCTVAEFNGEQDHIHMIIEHKPTESMSHIANILKGVTSRMMRKKYPIFNIEYYGKGIGMWSRSYFAASVGAVTLEQLKNYIEKQNIPI